MSRPCPPPAAWNRAQGRRGCLQIEVLANGALGSDSAMVEMVQKTELEMSIAGNVLGPLAPVTDRRAAAMSLRDGPPERPEALILDDFCAISGAATGCRL